MDKTERLKKIKALKMASFMNDESPLQAIEAGGNKTGGKNMGASLAARLMGHIRSIIMETGYGMKDERGRGFASDREAWAELKEHIERAQRAGTRIEKIHKEMWDAIKDRNDDAFTALAQEAETIAARLAGEWAQVAALAYDAAIGNEERASCRGAQIEPTDAEPDSLLAADA